MIKLLLITLFVPLFALAHEGHDKAPGAVNAPHGGLIQGTNQMYLELVMQKDGIKLFPFTHDLKPIALNEIKVEGNILFPKKTKGTAVKFIQSEDSLLANIDAKGSHRYTLDLTISYQGKKEKTKFNVEPQ